MLHLLLACTPSPPCADGEVRTEAGDCVALEGGGDTAGSEPSDSGTSDSGTSDSGTSDGGTGDTGGSDTGGGDDVDGDGWRSDVDCDDSDPAIHPEAPERCNGVDDDCDGLVPEQESIDQDHDGDAVCLDCDDGDPTMLSSDGSCAGYRFPLGYMSVEDPADFATLAAMGITRVHAYNFGPWPGSDVTAAIDWSTEYLDEAEAHGLTVLGNLNGRTWAESMRTTDEFAAFVDDVKDHPALASWYLADEPEASITAKQLRGFREVLDDTSPTLHVQIAHCWCTNWWSFWDSADVRMPDFYGIYDDPEPGAYAYYHPLFASYHRTYYSEDRVEPVMQGFNFGVYSDSDPEVYPEDSRFPTADELRFWAYSDLTLGVDALWWWSWYRANEHADGPAWLADTLTPVLTELRAFTDEVLPANHPVRINEGPYDDIDYTYLAMWPRPVATYVVATNGSAAARTLEVALGPDFAGATLSGWDTTGAVTLDEHGAATVAAAPYEVFIWTLARE